MNKRAIATIIAGFLTASIAFSIRYSYGMLLPEMLPDLGINKTQAGAILTAYFVIYTIGTPLLGALSDLYSYRLLITVFTAILGSGALLMAYADSFVQASLFFSIAALGHAACWAPVVVMVQKWVPDDKRATALSVVTMGVGAGILCWGLFMPSIVSAAGWRSGWLALGVFAISIAVLDLILVRDPVRPASGKTVSRRGPIAFLVSYREVFKRMEFWAIGGAYTMVGMSVIILFAFLPVYAHEALEMPYAHSTRLISMIALFGFGGQLVLGPLSDKIGRTWIMVFCSVIMSFACLGLVFSETIWMLYALIGLYGIGYGAVWPVYAAAASDHFPRNMTGGIVGLWTFLYGIGSIIAPIVSGWIIDVTGEYTGVFIFAAVAGTISIILLLAMQLLRKKRTLNPQNAD